MAASLRVTQVKSTISHIARNRATIRALGLHRIGDTVVVPDNDATRGMVRQVRFLVAVEEVAAPDSRHAGARQARAASSDAVTPEKPASRRASRPTPVADAPEPGVGAADTDAGTAAVPVEDGSSASAGEAEPVGGEENA
jgi:large subunit ribosomal protein L30